MDILYANEAGVPALSAIGSIKFFQDDDNDCECAAFEVLASEVRRRRVIEGDGRRKTKLAHSNHRRCGTK